MPALFHQLLLGYTFYSDLKPKFSLETRELQLRFSKIFDSNIFYRESRVAQWQRIRLPMQETWVPSVDGEDPLEKEMATHSSITA